MPPQHWFTFPAKWRQREERSNSKRIRCHFFLLARENFIAAQPIRRTTHRDLGGETSSVWHFRSSCPRRHFTRKSLIALRNPLLFSQATDLDVGAFACNGSKIKLATVLSRQGRVRIRRYDSFFGLTQRTRQNYTASLPQVLTHFNVCDNEQQRRNLLSSFCGGGFLQDGSQLSFHQHWLIVHLLVLWNSSHPKIKMFANHVIHSRIGKGGWSPRGRLKSN